MPEPTQPITQKIRLTRRQLLKVAAGLGAVTATNWLIGKGRQVNIDNDEARIRATVVAWLDSPKELERISNGLPTFLRQTAVYLEADIKTHKGQDKVSFGSGLVTENSYDKVVICLSKHQIKWLEEKERYEVVSLSAHQPQNGLRDVIWSSTSSFRTIKHPEKELGLIVIENSTPIPGIPAKVEIATDWKPDPEEDLYAFAFPLAATKYEGGYFPAKFHLSPLNVITPAIGWETSTTERLTGGASGSGVGNKTKLVGIIVNGFPGVSTQFVPLGNHYNEMIAQLSPK